VNAPQFMDVLRWRWMPCVGLVSASLLYVVVVVAVVPDSFEEPTAQSAHKTAGSRTQAGLQANDEPHSTEGDAESAPPAPPSPAPGPVPGAFGRRGFSPPLPRPDPPPAAPPPPPPPQPEPVVEVPPDTGPSEIVETPPPEQVATQARLRAESAASSAMQRFQQARLRSRPSDQAQAEPQELDPAPTPDAAP
jgi:hypothetical protein